MAIASESLVEREIELERGVYLGVDSQLYALTLIILYNFIFSPNKKKIEIKMWKGSTSRRDSCFLFRLSESESITCY